MELFEDFGGEGGPDRTALSARLLACYQQALGHELPNQLVAFVGLARVLEETQADRLDAEGRACLERLTALARRAGGLVSAVAAVGRLCRPAAPEAEPLSLAEVAREAVAEVKPHAAGAEVEWVFADDLPPLTVAHRPLYQVLVELLKNAAGSAAPGRPLRIRLGARRRPDGVEFSVADNGRGLPPGRAGHVFEPFAGPRGPDGFGLGLFLVRQLVAGWNGALGVRSEPGQGTTFTVLVRMPPPGGSR